MQEIHLGRWRYSIHHKIVSVLTIHVLSHPQYYINFLLLFFPNSQSQATVVGETKGVVTTMIDALFSSADHVTITNLNKICGDNAFYFLYTDQQLQEVDGKESCAHFSFFEKSTYHVTKCSQYQMERQRILDEGRIAVDKMLHDASVRHAKKERMLSAALAAANEDKLNTQRLKQEGELKTQKLAQESKLKVQESKQEYDLKMAKAEFQHFEKMAVHRIEEAKLELQKNENARSI